MSKKNPWFKFYPHDWLDSERVMAMSFAAKGLYIECLAHQAKRGSIPSDVAKLALLLRTTKALIQAPMKELAAHFEQETVNGEERLYNPRLREELQEVDAKQSRYSKGSKKGHENRGGEKQNPTQSETKPNTNPHQSQKNPALRASASVSVSVSDSVSESKTPESNQGDEAPAPAPTARQQQAATAHSFETIFWPAWPTPRKDKQAALKAWLKLNPGPELLPRIMAGLELAKRSDQWRKRGIVPHPSTWLNNARWEDEGDANPEMPRQETTEAECEALPEFTPLDPAVWENARFALKHEDPEAFEAWMETLEPLGYAGDDLWLRVQSSTQRGFLAGSYRDLLTRHLQAPVKFYLGPEQTA